MDERRRLGQGAHARERVAPPNLPSRDELAPYPPKIPARDGRRLEVRACKRAACVKCGEGTYAGYTDGARLWPTCLWCARRAAAIPCEWCGDVTPYMLGWDVHPTEGGGRSCRHHESGKTCYEP